MTTAMTDSTTTTTTVLAAALVGRRLRGAGGAVWEEDWIDE